jgi:hypothetical protein
MESCAWSSVHGAQCGVDTTAPLLHLAGGQRAGWLLYWTDLLSQIAQHVL